MPIEYPENLYKYPSKVFQIMWIPEVMILVMMTITTYTTSNKLLCITLQQYLIKT